MMELTDCSENELEDFKEKYSLKRWVMTGNPQKIFLDGEIVGLIDCSFAPMYGENAIMIDNFEVFKKGQGIGSKIIDNLLQEIKDEKIYLYAESNQSKNFWVRHGFTSVDDGSGVEILCFSVN